jgi:serine/tyrosine/threonine adenylyltransferase
VPLAIRFDNTYVRLPERFYARIAPAPVRAPQLLRLNAPLARDLGLEPDALASTEGVEVLAGNRLPAGADPIALAYAGHQFGQFVPQLGDGRALLIGEVVGPEMGRRDLQWKGSGRTPFSRGGDGRAALGPVLREYIVSEAMHALGVPTTRSLSAVSTGQPVMRERMLPGAILVRVARSHLRIGTFWYFAARRDVEGLGLLADHAIARHEPEAASAERPYLALLEGVIARQARLVARWMAFGFIHGVMNTDNMTISGETIDYGPCAFMDGYDPGAVFSSIDHHGRYAYGNQPRIAAWNLARLAEALLPLLADEEATAITAAEAALSTFGERFEQAYTAAMGEKIGLTLASEDDAQLLSDGLGLLAAEAADFTLVFRALTHAAADATRGREVTQLLAEGGALDAKFEAWAARWRARLAAEPGGAPASAERMRRANPAYIPRNHRVEEALRAAENGDLGPFEDLVAVLSNPFEEQPGKERYAAPPRPEERVTATFCGT